jgi:hypothetical protein
MLDLSFSERERTGLTLKRRTLQSSASASVIVSACLLLFLLCIHFPTLVG